MYEINGNTSCVVDDGWRISTTDAASATAPSCSTCTGQRAVIDFGAPTCAQDATLVVGSFTPSTTSVNVSFTYGYDNFRPTDVITVTLFNVTSPGNSVVLLNNAPGSDMYNQTFSTIATVVAGDTYEMRVRYRADYSYGVTVDSFVVEETIAPTTGSYTFRLEDGQQQDGYVLTSDASGYATWLPPSGGGGTDSQILSITGNDLSISNGNNITLPSTDAWELTGNAGTNTTTNFIGTTDAQDVVFRANNAENLRLTTVGQLEITNARNNIFIGKDAGESFNYSPATFGRRNIHIGTEAGFANQVRSDNISIGYFSMKSNTLGVPPLP